MKPAPRHAFGLLAPVLLAGCFSLPIPMDQSPSNGDTVGDLGQVDLTWDGPAGELCTLGCSLSMPLMAGDTEGIAVGPHVSSPNASLPTILFSSSDPAVFDVSPKRVEGQSPQERQTKLLGMAPGSATLFLHDASTNALLDSTTVRVAPAASLAISFQLSVPGAAPTTTGELTIAVGQAAAWWAHVRDAGGAEMAGWNAVTLEIADESILANEMGALAFVQALAAGKTTVTARAGSVSTVIAVTVTSN